MEFYNKSKLKNDDLKIILEKNNFSVTKEQAGISFYYEGSKYYLHATNEEIVIQPGLPPFTVVLFSLLLGIPTFFILLRSYLNHYNITTESFLNDILQFYKHRNGMMGIVMIFLAFALVVRIFYELLKYLYHLKKKTSDKM